MRRAPGGWPSASLRGRCLGRCPGAGSGAELGGRGGRGTALRVPPPATMRSAERCADLMATFSSGVCMSCRPEAMSALTTHQFPALAPGGRELAQAQCQRL